MPQAARKILIADVSASRRDHLKHQLLAVNPYLLVTVATSGAQCSSLLSQSEFELTFIAENMNETAGLDIMALVSASQTAGIVVMTSERLTRDFCQKAGQMGAYDCLQWPAEVEEIQRFLQRCQCQQDVMTALVVDDARVMRRVVFKVLQESEFQITASEAATTEMAISLCRTIPYDLIFMDYNMPGLNGLETAEAILKLQPNVRIILMTSVEDSDLIDEAKSLGLAGFLKKPFYPRDVDQVIHKLRNLVLPNLLQEDFLDSLTETSSDDDDASADTIDNDNVILI